MLSPAERVARTIRVDQAGEYGAVRIYQGQRAVLGKGASAKALAEIAEFDLDNEDYRVRPYPQPERPHQLSA